MAKTAVDAVADSNHQILHRIMQLAETPDYVKSAGVIDAEQVARLPQTAFADPVNRKFPVHTKAATWLAQTYFDESRHLYSTQLADRVQAQIDKAARYWNIAEHVKQASASIRATQDAGSIDLPDSDFAMVVKVDGQTRRMLPIHSVPNVKAAAAHLYNNRMKYPYEWRKTAARKILHKARELEVADIEPEASEFLAKAASFGSSIPAQVAEKLAHRVLMLSDSPEHKREKVAMSKLVMTVKGMKDIPAPSVMEKLAGIVDRFDREHSFYRYYDQGVETPEEIFFELTQKKAADLRDNYVQLTTGTVVPFTAIQRIKLDKVAAVVGDDFAKAVSADDRLGVDPEKFARIARTLPLDDATLLEKALSASGVMPERLSLADIAVPA
jgi:hypothetical protein